MCILALDYCYRLQSPNNREWASFREDLRKSHIFNRREISLTVSVTMEQICAFGNRLKLKVLTAREKWLSDVVIQELLYTYEEWS